MKKVTFLPEETTEVQTAVIELRAGQRKNVLKFGALMILLFAVVVFILGVTATISDLARPGVESAIGAFVNGTQKPRN